MNEQQPRRRPPAADDAINLRSAAVAVIAAALGAIAGGMAAWKLPSDKFAWTGFALAPLRVLLELLLKQLAIVFGGDRSATGIGRCEARRPPRTCPSRPPERDQGARCLQV